MRILGLSRKAAFSLKDPLNLNMSDLKAFGVFIRERKRVLRNYYPEEK